MIIMKKNLFFLFPIWFLSIAPGYGQRDSTERHPNTIRITTQVNSPLYILSVDDKLLELNPTLTPGVELEMIDPKHIKSINVVKQPEAAKKYGDKGKHGVVIITLNESSLLPNALRKKFDEMPKK